jgi:hypothetical protein
MTVEPLHGPGVGKASTLEVRWYRIVGRVDDYPMGTPALWFHKSLRT